MVAPNFDAPVPMTVAGLPCVLHMPPAIKAAFRDGAEVDQGLPPYAPRAAFPVDDYPAAPEHWMRGSATEGSFFSPVREGRGLWLDFNGCAADEYDIAIVVSIQGLNAITGIKAGTNLEQYREKCPKHDEPFGAERFCAKCGWKWPPQNYLATAGTPFGLLWLDGFRAADGRVRQWVFTADEARGVAAHVIGAERSHSLGISFYRSKEKKPVRARMNPYEFLVGGGVKLDSWLTTNEIGSWNYNSNSGGDGGTLNCTVGGPVCGGGGDTFGSSVSSFGGSIKSSPSKRRLTKAGMKAFTSHGVGIGMNSVLRSKSVKNLEVAAGARIRQSVFEDRSEMSHWREKPEGVLYVHYVDEEHARAIIDAGKRDLEAGGEGFLQGLRVGDPSGGEG